MTSPPTTSEAAIATELESAVRPDMALDSDPVLPVGTSLGKSSQPQFSRLGLFFQIDHLQGDTLTILETTIRRIYSPTMELGEGG